MRLNYENNEQGQQAFWAQISLTDNQLEFKTAVSMNKPAEMKSQVWWHRKLSRKIE